MAKHGKKKGKAFSKTQKGMKGDVHAKGTMIGKRMSK